MRKGVTLFITLSIIAAMLAVLGVVFTFLGNARTQAEVKASLIQSNLLYTDIKSTLRLLTRKPSVGKYTTLYDTPVAVATRSGEFNVMFHCSPIADRPNIAWLAMDGQRNRQYHFELAEKIFDALVQKANVRDPSLLHQKIVDALKRKKRMRFNILSNINKKKGTISQREFHSILDTYRYEADDDRADGIAWEDYFAFGDDMGKIDSSFIRPEVLALVFDIDLRLVQGDDGFKRGDSLKDFLEENGLDLTLYNWKKQVGGKVIELFAKKAPVDAMRCLVSYEFRDGQYAFRFDFIEKKAVNFEFVGH
jgi:hypothetical protein